MTSRTEIVILSGFLGSGKSTLLNQLLTEEKKKGRRVAVLMNEVGELSVDSAIVPNNTPLIELLNGCICCSIQGELSLQLKVLLKQYDLDVIYIESTGLAHPLEIIHACTNPELVTFIHLKAVITVVHAKQWLEQKMSIKLKKLMKEQLRFADVIVINHTDHLDNSEYEEVEWNIRTLNKRARFVKTIYASIEHVSLDSLGSNADLLKMEKEFDAHIHDHLHVRTVTIPLTKPVNRIRFTKWISQHDDLLYRAKGFVLLEETPGLYLFNLSYGEVIFERYQGSLEYDPVLILIGEDVNRTQMENELQELYVL